jgi:hypothetical protein
MLSIPASVCRLLKDHRDDSLLLSQLIMKSSTRYFAKGSIVADSHEAAKGLMVVTSGQIGIELPMDSEEADVECSKPNGKTLLYVLGRGYAPYFWLCADRTVLASTDLITLSRDCLGGGIMVGDNRWVGTYGVRADLVARCHCSVEIISYEDIQVFCHDCDRFRD